MIRLLPCGTCADGIARLRGGSPYWAGRWPGTSHGEPYRYRCAACRRLNTITASEFWARPGLTREQLEEHRILGHLSKDLTLGGELPPDHAADLFVAGFTPQELAGLPPQEPKGGE